MIDLYAAGTSNGLRARMALEETGLPYNLKRIALDKGENKTPQYLALNPNGQIPTIVDHEGPGGKPITLTQSNAILMYCAEKSGKFLPKDAAGRAAVWEALMSAATDVNQTVGSVFAVVRSKEPHQPTADIFKDRFRQYMKVWDDKLAKRKYAAGSEITVADISLYAAYARAKQSAPDLFDASWSNLERWAKEMGERPAMQRALKF
jgi:GST-like protein